MPNPNILSYLYQGIRNIKNYMSVKFYNSSTKHFDFMGENVKIF
jgi:hypothetical protein